MAKSGFNMQDSQTEEFRQWKRAFLAENHDPCCCEIVSSFALFPDNDEERYVFTIGYPVSSLSNRWKIDWWEVAKRFASNELAYKILTLPSSNQIIVVPREQVDEIEKKNPGLAQIGAGLACICDMVFLLGSRKTKRKTVSRDAFTKNRIRGRRPVNIDNP